MVNKTVFIGIGNAGCKILSKVEDNINRLYLHTDKNVVSKYSGLRIGEKTCGEYSTMGDEKLGERSAKENKNDILNKISKYKYWVIITSLGGGTSCGVTKKIIDFGNEYNKTLLVFTGMPFEFEGKCRKEKAEKTLSYLKENSAVVTLNFDKTNLTLPTSLNDVFVLYDEIFLKEISKLLIE